MLAWPSGEETTAAPPNGVPSGTESPSTTEPAPGSPGHASTVTAFSEDSPWNAVTHRETCAWGAAKRTSSVWSTRSALRLSWPGATTDPQSSGPALENEHGALSVTPGKAAPSNAP